MSSFYFAIVFTKLAAHRHVAWSSTQVGITSLAALKTLQK